MYSSEGFIIEGGKVTGVEAESGGETFTVACDRVVLSAGALKSPHILMLSGIGPSDQLAEHGIPVLVGSPGVGQNLFNHPMGSVTFQVRDDVKLTANAEALRFGLQSNLGGTLVPQRRDAAHAGHLERHDRRNGAVWTRRESPARFELPEGTGWVRLQSADPTVQPSINYRYLHNENDMRRMRDAVKLACSLLESDAYQGISEGRTAPDDETLGNDDKLDAWIRQTLGSSRHVSGTCRIGPDGDAMAVTDQQCRVRGVEGLWVADSSIMPQVTRANTNATAIMIGERVASWVAQDGTLFALRCVGWALAANL